MMEHSSFFVAPGNFQRAFGPQAAIDNEPNQEPVQITLQQIVKRLGELGISSRRITHDSVHTMDDNARVTNDPHPAKNLLLQAKGNGEKVLVVMQGGQQLDSKALQEKLDIPRKLQFASPEVLQDTLGAQPGSASVFGLLHRAAAGVRVVFDRALLEADELGFHPPGDNSQTIYIPPSGIQPFLGTVGNEYQITDVPYKA